MIRVVESKQKDIRRWSMTIYIDSTYQKRKTCYMVFECSGFQIILLQKKKHHAIWVFSHHLKIIYEASIFASKFKKEFSFIPIR
jgi:hypothetical protein